MTPPLRWSRLTLTLLPLVFSGTVQGDLCTVDAVPAATLLLPYFEVDIDDPSGLTTLFSVNNAAAEAALAHVTLWTDYAQPTLRFDVYLTGYDVQTINVRDLFRGFLPTTAGAGLDPGDTVSPQGPLSEDVDFPDCGIQTFAPPVLGDALIRAHRGLESPTYGGCVAFPHDDGHVRGYITVDAVSRCSPLAPSDPGYFAAVVSDANVLWGTYYQVDPANNAAQQETLVHIEGCPSTPIGTPLPGTCHFASEDYTFYGRYVANADDQREPLPSTLALSYVNGGAFDGGTQLVVWRDTKLPPGPPGSCARSQPSWYPLPAGDVVSFDEQETPSSHCLGGIVDPPPPTDECLPLATQSVKLGLPPVPLGEAIDPPSNFGWLFLSLVHETGDRFPGRAQAWVTTVMTAAGRLSVSSDAIALDQGCTAATTRRQVF